MSYMILTMNIGVLAFVLLIYTWNNCHREINFWQKSLVFYIWMVSFLPLCILPLEINELGRNFEQPITDLSDIWLVYYYLNLVNGYVILPITIGYYISGYFSVRGRLLEALLSSLLFYVFGFFFAAITYLIVNYQYQINIIEIRIFVPKIINTIFYFVYCLLLSLGLFRFPLSYLRSDFYLKIHQKLIIFEDHINDYQKVIFDLNDFYDVH